MPRKNTIPSMLYLAEETVSRFPFYPTRHVAYKATLWDWCFSALPAAGCT